jgi:hypothetical protein
MKRAPLVVCLYRLCGQNVCLNANLQPAPGLIWQRIRVVCASFESGDMDVSSSITNTHVGYILIVLAIIQIYLYVLYAC